MTVSDAPSRSARPAPPPAPAVAAGPAGAANRLVVGERAIADGHVHDAGGEEVGGVHAAALGDAAVLAVGPGPGDRRIVLERAAADGGDPAGDVDAAAESVVGAGKGRC